MEINGADDSYLVQVTVGDTEYVVRRLLSSELASLHSSRFGKWSREGKTRVIKLDILPAFGVTMPLPINLDRSGRFTSREHSDLYPD